MTTFTWKITQLDRELADGYVFTAHYIVNTECGVQSYGSLRLDRPKGEMIPFEELTEKVVIGWIKDVYGAEVIAIEAAMQARIDEVTYPTTAVGIPWATERLEFMV